MWTRMASPHCGCRRWFKEIGVWSVRVPWGEVDDASLAQCRRLHLPPPRQNLWHQTLINHSDLHLNSSSIQHPLPSQVQVNPPDQSKCSSVRPPPNICSSSRSNQKNNTVCPSCSNILIVTTLPSTQCSPSDLAAGAGEKNRFECRTCPYQMLLDRRYFERKTFESKAIEDVLGGADSWANVDKTPSEFHHCSLPFVLPSGTVLICSVCSSMSP